MSRPVWSLPKTIWMIQRRHGRRSCGQMRPKYDIFGINSTCRIWRKKKDEYNPKNTIPTVKHGGGNLMEIRYLKIIQCEFLDFFFFFLDKTLTVEVYLRWKLQISPFFVSGKTWKIISVSNTYLPHCTYRCFSSQFGCSLRLVWMGWVSL